ncbi:MAG TPA: MarR family winged helix-turn-helix transcriptional regulator [Paludibacter sp.]|nr:MarR family winged helix-turn-helix transcriptional regulator [Paludibacter sp.]
MKTKEILIELLELLETYESENSGLGNPLNTTDFIEYLNSHQNPQKLKVDELSGGIEDWRSEEMTENMPVTDISILVVLLFRYAKGYIKKALKASQIKTADEFSFLITLLTYESMTKMELINMQIMEKTSGNEIINRLIKFDFIEQTKDQTDKRSVRIKITPKGRYEILSVLPQMQLVSKIVVGNLKEKEKNTLAFILRKLDHYHNDIFQNNKDCDLSEILPPTP